jgi:metal-sulfur cluster biosynthetic enzyme
VSAPDRCERPASAAAAVSPAGIDTAAVRSASSRTHHEPNHAGVAAEDPRYRSAEPAEQRVWVALREVMDPEIPISLVDLGLICAVRREGGRAEIDLTFTATACPCMAFIREDITERLLREEDVDRVDINEVWDPPWTVDRMTAEGRRLIGGFGVAA